MIRLFSYSHAEQISQMRTCRVLAVRVVLGDSWRGDTDTNRYYSFPTIPARCLCIALQPAPTPWRRSTVVGSCSQTSWVPVYLSALLPGTEHTHTYAHKHTLTMALFPIIMKLSVLACTSHMKSDTLYIRRTKVVCRTLKWMNYCRSFSSSKLVVNNSRWEKRKWMPSSAVVTGTRNTTGWHQGSL